MSRSLRACITVESKTAELEAFLKHPETTGKIYVVVEGLCNDTNVYGDDKKFYGQFFDSSKVDFFEAGGYSFTSQIVNHFNSSTNYKDRVIGIRDADFSHITNYSPINNLFLTDTHDWETMAIKGGESLRKMCSEMSMDYDPNLYRTIMDHLKPLSHIRLYNCLKQRSDPNYNGINFNKIGFHNYYGGDKEIDLNTCLTELKKNNNKVNPFPNESDIRQQYDQYRDVDLYQLTRGHDIVHALQQRYRYLNQGTNSIHGEKDISCILRTAYTYTDFQQTKLYKDIDAWANNRSLSLWAT